MAPEARQRVAFQNMEPSVGDSASLCLLGKGHRASEIMATKSMHDRGVTQPDTAGTRLDAGIQRRGGGGRLANRIFGRREALIEGWIARLGRDRLSQAPDRVL